MGSKSWRRRGRAQLRLLYPCDFRSRCNLIRFETKIKRALHAKVMASETNWMECQSSERLMKWWQARKDLEAFQQGQRARQNRERSQNS